MSNKYINLCALCCTIMSIMFLGCKREDYFCCLPTSEREFARSLRGCLSRCDGLVELREAAISESVSNALVKAKQRKQIGANYRIIPVYCSICEPECYGNSELKCRGDGLCLRFSNFGVRAEWSDLKSIWLIAVFQANSVGYSEVIETSLANITHGMGSSWSDFRFGDFKCRCYDPRLGWGEKLSWNALVANGECKMYLLLDDGSAWGRRHGRTFSEASKLKCSLNRYKGKGVLIELIPVAASKQECVLECR